MDQLESNPYSPPNSAVADIPAVGVGDYFFAASALKFVLMAFCTFGLYTLYWSYMNWRLVKQRSGESLMPFWRAFFSVFWTYSLFEEINHGAKRQGVDASVASGLLALAYFVLSVLSRLPDPWGLVIFFAFLCFLPANNVALQVNASANPGALVNSRFSAWNIVALALGGLIMILGIVGTFMPEPVG